MKYISYLILTLLMMCSQSWALVTYNNSRTVGVETWDTHAGAVVAVFWNGLNYVNNHDFGRQIQVAMQINNKCEGFNPTEAGTKADPIGPGKFSSSQGISHYNPSPNVVCTTSRPAFWRIPKLTNISNYGPQCNGYGDVVNYDPISTHALYKTITVGIGPSSDEQRIIKFQVSVRFDKFGDTRITNELNPDGPPITLDYFEHINVEAPTGYLNKMFTTFWRHDGGKNWSVIPLNLDHRITQWQHSTMMVTDELGDYAMGIWAPPKNGVKARLGGARFKVGHPNPRQETLKWSVNRDWWAVDSGELRTNVAYIVVGTKSDVARIMDRYVIDKLY